MADPRIVFLSYRREVSWATAHLVRDKLVPHGFDVFLDVHGLGRGEFERVLLREIERREHFLVLLEPRSLDRIADEGDWLRREIAHALAHRRNIVPVTANGARMPAPVWRPSQPSALSAPTLSVGPPNRRSARLITIVWTEVDGAVGYEVEQSASAAFTRSLRTDVSGCTHVLPPARGEDRFVRVRAVVGLLRGPWSNTILVY